MTKRRSIMMALAIMSLSMVFLAASCPPSNPTYGTKWQGDFSQCSKTSADKTIQTIGGDDGHISKEFGSVSPPNYGGHPGCDAAFVLDYLMPAPGTNVNPGWDWAWIHVASRIPDITPSQCNELWTSLRVYAYWTFQGNPQEQLILESYRRAKWTGVFCDFGLPDNVWMSSAYQRVRAVSQHGGGFLSLQPHYSYFVTNRHES